MPILQNNQAVHCPLCGGGVRLHFRNNKWLDHYETLSGAEKQIAAGEIFKLDPRVAKELRRERNGKKTVAIVGLAPMTCGLAPFDEPDVGLDKHIEIWGLNEAHDFPWMRKWSRWFQLHPERLFKRVIEPHHGVKFHYEWLKKDHHKPIYMQHIYPEIPNSVEYPLQEIVNKFFSKLKHGKEQVKYFNSSVDYMIAYAIFTGKFDRIELYGIEMASDTEYIAQKSGVTFWIGTALAQGIEVYYPEQCHLMSAPLYAYQGQGARNEI